MDELDLADVTLVAHDWGGPIGLGAMLDHADRLSAAVLINTWAWELPSFVPPFIREFRTEGLGEILVLGGNLFVESIPGGMANRETDPVMMEAYRAPFPDYWSRVGMLAFQRDIPFTERDRSAALMGSIHERLEQLDIPVTLVWGMRDPVFQPVFMDQWRELFPDARVVELEDAAHFVPEDRPDAVTARTQRVAAAARREAASMLSTLRGSTSTRSRLPNTTWRITPPKRSEIIRASSRADVDVALGAGRTPRGSARRRPTPARVR